MGYEPLRELFAEVAVPVADELTRGAFLGPWRLMLGRRSRPQQPPHLLR